VPSPSLGFSLDTDSGVIVTVKPGGIAARGGLLVGDTILEMDGLPPMTFLAGEWWPRDGKPVLVKVQRDGRQLWRTLCFDEGGAPPPAAEPAESADPFRGLFGSPAPERLQAPAATALIGVAADCQLGPGHPMLPARRGIDRPQSEPFAERARLRATMPPPMTNFRGYWVD
jgi:hypothetical protein